MANIIYHIPWKIKEGRKSATGVRPLEMLKSFIDLGHVVDIVMGNAVERKNSMSKIKEKISTGFKYDLVYSESSVAPTFIASGWRDYLKYGSLDLKFLKYCSKKGIHLSLFYRDMYWMFPRHTHDSSIIKRTIMQVAYRLDLSWYKKWLDTMYLPSLLMDDYLGKHRFRSDELPPGGFKYVEEKKELSKHNPLKLFYVGGATNGYRLHKLFSVVSNLKDVELRFCTRKNEWDNVSHEYTLSDNIQIIHKSGEDLKAEYELCDIALLFFEYDEYRSFSMPVKMFESISYLKPIIATERTAAGDWVLRNKAGWVIPYAEENLNTLLTRLKDNKELVFEKTDQLITLNSLNLWTSRAAKVVDDLTKYQ